MFTKWLSLITQKEINDKTILENACKDEEDIRMAISALTRQSEDKEIRHAYERRKDEIYFYNKALYDAKTRAELAEIEIEKLRQQIADLQSKQNA